MQRAGWRTYAGLPKLKLKGPRYFYRINVIKSARVLRLTLFMCAWHRTEPPEAGERSCVVSRHRATGHGHLEPVVKQYRPGVLACQVTVKPGSFKNFGQGTGEGPIVK
jgi:hypothetical protein